VQPLNLWVWQRRYRALSNVAFDAALIIYNRKICNYNLATNKRIIFT